MSRRQREQETHLMSHHQLGSTRRAAMMRLTVDLWETARETDNHVMDTDTTSWSELILFLNQSTTRANHAFMHRDVRHYKVVWREKAKRMPSWRGRSSDGRRRSRQDDVFLQVFRDGRVQLFRLKPYSREQSGLVSAHTREHTHTMYAKSDIRVCGRRSAPTRLTGKHRHTAS